MKKQLLLFLVLFCFSTVFSAESIIMGVRQVGQGFEGVLANLEVIVEEGDGHVFIDTLPLTEVDTQASARLAKEVACETLNVNCSDKDFFYIVRGEFPMVGGPSAGAAMTILTMSELAGVEVNPEVAITGTVNPDGSVGTIGGVLEKAVTASKAGVTTFLIPQGQIGEIGNYTFNNSMRVVEVFTVRQAYGYFTNIYFEEAEDEIYFDEFNTFMKPMSEELMSYSTGLFTELESQYNISELNSEDQTSIDYLISSAANQLSDMNDLYDNKSYYSAASYAVGLGINTLYTTYLLNYFISNDTEYINSLFSFVNSEISRVEEVINQSFTINHVNDLEAINIAIDRFFEAKKLYEEAMSSYSLNNIPSTLYNIAFTYIRLKTSETWLTLKDVFEDELDISFTQYMLKELALARIETATTMITYAESGYANSYTMNANEHLITSREAYNEGNYIFSLFESLKALSNANLAMQLTGVSQEQISSKIELAKKQARQDINIAQSNNLMPILALSYYEYSLTFEETNPAQTLLFLEYSKQFSLLASQMVNHINTAMIEEPFFEILTPEEIGSQLTIVILGAILGVGVTILLLFRLFL
jgi:uncharacterized protein